MLPSKEMCEAMLVLVHRNCHKIPEDDYDRLYTFLKVCKPRLPTAAALKRDRERKASRPLKA